MCKFFSCIIDQDKKVYWKEGVESHSDLVKIFKLKEPNLPNPPTNKQIANSITWAKIEISPKSGDYLVRTLKKNWKLTVDEPIKPVWWNKSYEKPCWEVWKQATTKLYSTFNWKEAKNSINPFKIKAPLVTKEHIKLVKKWDSVRYSVGNSVGNSVWDSVWDSVRNSVWDSVRYSVRNSVRYSVRYSVGNSVGAYIGSLFPNIKKWKGVESHNGYPFQSAVDLWKQGLVPVYYQNKWHLYGSPKGNGKAEMLWEEE